MTAFVDDLAALVEQEVAAGATPALSVAFSDGGTPEAGAWGDAAPGRPVTTETMFQAASISKPVTAFAALRLAAAGTLDLDCDINEMLVTWKLPPVRGWAPRVTVRHLLSHSAGLTVHGFPGYRRGEPTPTVVQILDGVAPANTGPVRVEAIPGLHAKYSGGGYTVLGQLLADVTGKPLPDLLEELVLEPLGMVGARFEGALPAELANRVAHGREAGEAIPGGWHDYPELGAAGLWCTPADLVRFASGVQRAAAGALPALLPEDMARDMLTEQVPGWGLGVVLDGEGAARRFSHSGRNAGFLSLLVASCEPGPAVAVMANADSASPVMRSVAARVAAHLAWDSFERPEGPDLLAIAKRLAGAYVTDAGERFELVLGTDSFALVAPGQPGLPLAPIEPTVWISSAVSAELRVELGESAEGDVLVLHQMGRAFRASREAPTEAGSSPSGT